MEELLHLPKELDALHTINDEERFHLLTHKLDHLALFLEKIAPQYTWMQKHSKLIEDLLRHVTDIFFRDRMPLQIAKRILWILQKNWDDLSHKLPNNITLELQDNQIEVNSLLLAASSPPLREKIRQECRLDQSSILNLTEYPIAPMRLILDFMQHGTSTLLWRSSERDIFATLIAARDFALPKLERECEEEARRFIHESEVVRLLLKAHEIGAHHIKKACIDFYNETARGVRFHHRQEADLTLKLQEVKEVTIRFFEKMAPYLTHLSFSDNVLDDIPFPDLLNQCPHLVGIGVEQSYSFSERLTTLPQNLREIDLSQCEWLNASTLEQIVRHNPHITRWTLASNPGLNYAAWGQLARAPSLSTLNVARCHNLTDAELRILIEGCVRLQELNIAECRSLTEAGFRLLARIGAHLRSLTLTRLPITDPILIAMAQTMRHLEILDLTRCRLLTEAGIEEALNFLPSLHSLNLSHCRVNGPFLKKLRTTRPLTVLGHFG
ncbi:MAG: BTB/POZ domain-containing protein [Chlamydiia bacterium]|nr:BTB/POZ domain-containing protein [Chlamydiia bacterium]